MSWRSCFLTCSRQTISYERRHEKFVIHGHTISEDIDSQRNRIGIDTGAYLTDRLTAIGLEGTERWYVQTLPLS
jgi:serine/threonine protein phosphatase 1